MRIDGATNVKRILAFFRAHATRRAAPQDGHADSMSVERLYASQPYPFEWE
jgi:hypothetical protein